MTRRGRGRRRAALVAAALAAVVLSAPVAARGAVGTAGVGDPYFPNAGNGGYDVARYNLGLRYAPRSGILRGTALITATATDPLDRFNLDLRHLRVRSVRVDGTQASFRHHGQELEITPAAQIAAGARFDVRVRYRGRPHPVTDADGSREGWIRTHDGAIAPSEPQGTPSWFPGNDHPSDKAAFRFRITVPRKHKAISNGSLVRRSRSGGRRTWTWRQPEPMATYLATVAIGRFKLTRSDSGPVPSLFAVDPKARRKLRRPRRALRPLFATPRVVRYFTRLLGPYPFSSSGGILDYAPMIPYALETQARPIYAEAPSWGLVVHEVAHQWLGNSVTPATWRDIWLNEGFAAWSEWIWSEDHGGPSAAQIFDQFYATPARDRDFWNPPPGEPGGPAMLFNRTIYERGAMTLQALRERVGDPTFFAILRAWVAENRYANVSTSDFIALAERESGADLDNFFRIWLYKPGKPRNW